MFRGRFEHSMDEKGRLAIPAKYRELIAHRDQEATVIVTNFDKCLAAYPLKEWEALEERFAKLPQFDPKVIAFQRYFISGAVECPLDKAGRILVPAHLRQVAKIDKDCILTGALTKFEIWSQSTWEAEFTAISADFMQLTQDMAALGLAL